MSTGVGPAVETVMAERLDAEHVAEEADTGSNWCDLRTAAGTPVEVKAARLRVSDGRDATRAGRWWIGREAHRRLLAESGRYALVVYDGRPEDPDLVRTAVVPARVFDALISTWTRVGERSDSDADEAARVPHTRLFGRGGGDGE